MVTTSVLGHEINISKNDNDDMSVYDDYFDPVFDIPASLNPTIELAKFIMRERIQAYNKGEEMGQFMTQRQIAKSLGLLDMFEQKKETL